MSVYKPSNLTPNLEEVSSNDTEYRLSCQVNTSGESIKAYAVTILSEDGSSTIYEEECHNCVNSSGKNTPVKNKQFLKTDKELADYNIQNGNNYQWGIRTYNNEKNSTLQPNTLICDGYTVGSTKYIVWSQIPNNNSKGSYTTEEKTAGQEIQDQILYDRYIEFTATSKDDINVGFKPDDSISYPSAYPYRERQKIDWVTKDLGSNLDYVKIETEEKFTYNYNNGIKYSIYQCSDEHGINNFFADPNSEINVADFIMIYDSLAKAQEAREASDTPVSITVTQAPCMKKVGSEAYAARKIINYSSDTGEMRFYDSFSVAPVNGQYYRLFEFDNINNVYTAIDDAVVTVGEVSTDPLTSHAIGGCAIASDYFKVETSCWNDSKKQLFIQPNVNIKTDKNNPPEIVFPNGARLDIIKTTGKNVQDKTIDTTFNKLDDSQWLLSSSNLNLAYGSLNQYLASDSKTILPQTDYKVYTDFMDAQPYSLFYARTVPTIYIQAKNYNLEYNEEDPNAYYTVINEGDWYDYRDMQFQGIIKDTGEDIALKYYKYELFDSEGNEIESTSDTYNGEITPASYISSSGELIDKTYESGIYWLFRGLQSEEEEPEEEESGKTYTLKLTIVDQYDNIIEKSVSFGIYYVTDSSAIPLVVSYECNHENAIMMQTQAPVFAYSSNYGDTILQQYSTAVYGDLVRNEDSTKSINYLNLDSTKILNYTNVSNEEDTPLDFPHNMGILTHIKLTSDLIYAIPEKSETTFLSFTNGNGVFDEEGNEGTDEYKLTIYDTTSFFYQPDILQVTDESISAGDESLNIPDESTSYISDHTLNTTTNTYVTNPYRAWIKIYKNNELITTPCFCYINNGVPEDFDNHFDGTKIISASGGVSPTAKYVLQPAENYVEVEQLPTTGVEGQMYLLTADCTWKSQIMYAGVYTYTASSMTWALDSTYNYLFAESKSDYQEDGFIESDLVDENGKYSFEDVSGNNGGVPYLTFSGSQSFTIKRAYAQYIGEDTKTWDGTLQYSTNLSTWADWDGSTEIQSVNNKVYMRGINNHYMSNSLSNWLNFTFTTDGTISCLGNIENLLDYSTVASGEHPSMTGYGFMMLFYGCTQLVYAPILPATTLTSWCYYSMFSGCTSLVTMPSLPATTLTYACYNSMFSGCTSLKISQSNTLAYPNSYRIPTYNTGTTATGAVYNMFSNTGGSFKGTPSINTTYYTNATVLGRKYSWIEVSDQTKDIIAKAFKKTWITLYIVLDNTATRPISCYITAKPNQILGG